MVLSNISFGGDGPNTDHPLTFNNGSKNNANDENISLMNDEFHTLTIDWREDQVDYFIDGVLQESFDTNVAMGMSEVIIGFRQLTWAGDFNWTGDHTLVIDYFKIEALNALSTQENQLS
jgi:beta-glucanase (GH16 family)